METRISRRLATSFVLALSINAGAAVAAGMVAEGQLAATKGNNVAGTVTFTEQAGKVHVVAKLTGLAPGSHGFHVHEKGDCGAPDATSAGGHFNPSGEAHGHPGKGPHHAGDMPMLVADASGKAELTLDMAAVTLASGPTSLIGKAVIIHADPDDYATQPTGNSGARVACGVIALRN